MIVGSYFEGDVDLDAALRQHDVYVHALHIIVSTCNRYARFARSVLDDTKHTYWGEVDSYDHRTMQTAHDLLAAVWRFRHDFLQPKLPLETKGALIDLQRHWLEWLRREISGWTYESNLVRSVQLILANQNETIGYRAEAALCLGILEKFGDIPWNDNIQTALEFPSDLIERPERVRCLLIGKPYSS